MNQNEFFTEVCRRMGWPTTPLSLSVLNAWALMEHRDSDADGLTDLFEEAWNPLATTWLSPEAPRSTRDIGFGPGKWNLANSGRGVGIYRDADAGIAATVLTLSQPQYYGIIREAMRTQQHVDGLAGDFITYIGSEGYALELASFFKRATGEAKNVTKTEYEDLVLALFSGAEERDAQGVTLGRAERLPVALYRMKEAAEGRKRSVADVAYSSEAAAPGGSRVPPHVHELNLVVTQTGGAR